MAGVIPWAPLPPLRARIAPLADDCEPGQLTASLAWRARRQQRADQVETLAATVHVTNVSAAACLVPARPPLRLLDQRGTALDTASVDGAIGPDHFTFPSRWRFQTRPHVLLLQAGGSAELTVEWVNWCRPVPEGVSVELRSADGGRALVATPPIGGAAPSCFDRTRPTTWDTTELQPATPTDGTLVGGPDTLNRHLDVPEAARAGADLRFEVTLRNADPLGLATWVVPLRPCPDYTIGLDLLGPGDAALWSVHRKWRHALRCEALGGQLGAGDEATFEMVVPIPADARPGHSLLTWTLAGHGTEAEFHVTPP